MEIENKIKIEVNNSLTLIQNLNIYLFKELNMLLSFNSIAGYYKQKFTYERVHLLSPDGLFPTGLLPKVDSFLRNKQLEFDLIDYRNPPNRDFFLPVKKPLKLRPYQKLMVESAITAGRGIIESATGTGKSIIIQAIIHHYKLPTLVVVPNLNIMHQLYNNISRTFGAAKVTKISGGYKNLKPKHSIFVASVQSLPKLPQRFFDGIGLLIIDEFHHSAAESYQSLNMNQFKNIYHRFGLTGTNFRNDGSDMALEGVLSNVLCSYDAIDAIRDGYLCPVKFVFYDFKHVNATFKNYREEYTAQIVDNIKYNQSIARIANAIARKGNISLIIMVKEIKHGLNLKELIPDSQFITGEESESVSQKMIWDFGQKKFNILIGTSVIGEGVDIPCAQVGIIAGGGKAKSDIIQKIGRFLRPHHDKTHATIIDFTHQGSKTMWEHARLRRTIYSKYGDGLISDRLLPQEI